MSKSTKKTKNDFVAEQIIRTLVDKTLISERLLDYFVKKALKKDYESLKVLAKILDESNSIHEFSKKNKAGISYKYSELKNNVSVDNLVIWINQAKRQL